MRAGAAIATRSHASAALTPPTKKAARQPASSATMSAQANDSAPEMPMLAACPAAARDTSFASILSARSLRPGHVGAGPPDTGERARDERRPEAIGKQCKEHVAEDRHGDAGKINPLRVDAVGQRDKDRYREDVGAIEDRGDPSGFTVGQRPASDHARQQSRPKESTDLDERLRYADEHDQVRRRQIPEVILVHIPIRRSSSLFLSF